MHIFPKFFLKLSIIYFIFWLHCMGFLQLRGVGATLCCGAWTSLCNGFSRCGALLQDAWASIAVTHAAYLAALLQVGSTWTRDQTCVVCIGRWILNHWTTREALCVYFIHIYTYTHLCMAQSQQNGFMLHKLFYLDFVGNNTLRMFLLSGVIHLRLHLHHGT